MKLTTPLADRWKWLFRDPIFQSLTIYTGIIMILIWPTLGLYAWSGHDQLFPVIRVYEVCKVWRAQGPGHVPWAPDWAFGYGYPFHTFYQPFGYYVGALFHFLLGLDYGPATKMSFYSAVYLSGLAMYALVYVIGARDGWPRLQWWALAAATVFSLTRYHLTDMFVRADLGESWAWSTVAGVFLGAEIARRRRLFGFLVIAMCYSFLMLSHNITALYGTIAVGLYTLLTMIGARNSSTRVREPIRTVSGSSGPAPPSCESNATESESRWFGRVIQRPLVDIRWPFVVMAGGALGSGMAAFFWLPAITLLKLTNAGLSSRAGAGVASTISSPRVLHSHALYWQQYFTESLGTQGSIPGPDDNMGINLGIAVLVGLVLAAIALFRSGLSVGQRYRLGVCLGLTTLVLFVMSKYMNWTRVPSMLLFVQFPWRLLIFTAFFGCLATAMASPVISGWLHPLVWTLIAILLAIPTLPLILTLPGKLTDHGTTERVLRWYVRQERLNWYGGNAPQEFWPLTVKPPLTDPKFLYDNPPPENRLTPMSGEIEVQNYQHKGTGYTYSYTAPATVTAKIALIFFPGWELKIDGQKQKDAVSVDDKGLVRVQLPAGLHTAELKYTLSPVGKIARNISYLAWFVWISSASALVIWGLKRKSRRCSPSSADLVGANHKRE